MACLGMTLTAATARLQKMSVGILSLTDSVRPAVARGAYAALTTFWERRQRVQTRIRLMPPLIIARTFCRFGSNRLGLTLWAWLTCRPTTGPLPQISQRLAITALLALSALSRRLSAVLQQR